jgi:hypothetical protein
MVQQLNELINSQEFAADVNKIDTKGNRAAGTRARKVLKEATDTVKNIRQAILDNFKDDAE